MNTMPRIEAIRRAAVRRRLAIVLGCAALPFFAAVALAARGAGVVGACVAGALGLAAIALCARAALRRIDARWIARRLDATSPALEDSAALLFAPDDALTRVQRLQRTRLQARIAGLDLDLRPAWPRRAFAASGLLAAALLALAAWAPIARHDRGDASGNARSAARADATAIAQVELAIDPPAYTRRSARTLASLDAKTPEGSRLRWRLRFEPQPSAASLQFHDGRRVALVRSGERWTGEDTLVASALYRVVLEGAPAPVDDRLHRLDAIPDQPPEVRVDEPQKTLNLLDPQQKAWNLAFEAADDYGIASAELQLTLAQGGGENVKFRQQTIALAPVSRAGATAPREPDGDVPAEANRYAYRLDLAALGLSRGDDVIVRIAVADNREPKPNLTRSASFILRWPADPSSDTAGLEGIAQKTMPAYFRSQRQIIIDSEALIAAKATLDADAFLARSDAIGVDQKILRLRHGQFLGEESETQAAPASLHDGHDADPSHGGHADGAAPTQAGALAAAHAAHEHTSPASAAKFGEEGDTLAEYGHVHDIAEAATLLDPETRATLKSALGQMWQAELHLRQGHPDAALPYEHRALEFIKQVQQSTRIYLARVGLELPQADETRRLSGERKGLADRVGTLAAAGADDTSLAQLWRALDEHASPDWDAAGRWVAAHQASLPDALGVLAAIDRARRDPACAECRVQLRNLLWPLLPVPAANTVPRRVPDAVGRAYLDALHEGATQGGAR